MTDKTVSVSLRQLEDYRFEVNFDRHIPVVIADEPPPLGTGTGPSPCLLYTSPSPRDATLSRMPSSA